MARPRSTKEETRERILIKADALFRQYGFGKTTIGDIAADLDMSPANIYKFFESKSAIVEACAERNLSLMHADVERIMRSRKPALTRFEAVILSIYRFHKELFRNERHIFRMVVQAIEEAWPCIQAHEAFLVSAIKSLLEEGIAAGEIRRGKPAELSQAIADALHIALYPHLRVGWNSNESEARVRAHLRFVLSALP